ncbi:prepilin peptidase [Novosphingobium sp.]|uniref:prepilin peptidase n=1 Tax=Novosphingobium sp. TaxID=1874826 RepID=UPI003B51F04A
MVFVLAFVVGAVIGSFVTLVADRLPHGETWVTGRSSCRSCAHPLGPLELVPLVSYIVQRGRCAHCRAALPPDLWLGELAGAAVAVIAVARGGDPAGIMALALFGWALVLLALLDARHLWLPDAITLPLAAGGLAAALVLPFPAFGERALGLALGWLALEALRQGYRRLRHREGLGGGDPKLLGAIGAWLGASSLPVVVLVAALIGLAWAGLQAARGRPAGGTTPIPLGTMLALAALAWIAFGQGVLA